MNAEEIKDYRTWQHYLITVAISDFGYAHDVIEPLVEGHEFQEYYEDGYTPFNAMQAHDRDGL